MNVPLDDVIHFDAVTSAATGAATDADATPTFEVFEEANDTPLGVSGNFTKRTDKTGDYRGTFTASAANGFEVGKWYNVVASATIGGVTGKWRALVFRVTAAENAAGIPQVDPTRLNGSALAAQVLAARNYAECDDWVVLSAPNQVPATRAANLRTAYTAAKSLSPTKAHRTITLVGPGIYDFATGDGSNHGLVADGECVDLIGLTGCRDDAALTSSIVTSARGTLEQTASDVHIENLRLDINAGSGTTNAAYSPSSDLPLTKVRNVRITKSGTHGIPTPQGYFDDVPVYHEYSGYYQDIEGPDFLLGGSYVEFSGLARRVYGGQQSLVATDGVLSGRVIDSEADAESFAGDNGTLSGEVIRSIGWGSGSCFGAGKLSGTCVDCLVPKIGSGAESFGDNGTEIDGGGINGGVVVRCIANGLTYGVSLTSAFIVDSVFSTPNNVDCFTLLDSNSRIHYSSIGVPQGGTGVPINAASALNVSAVGNAYNNKAVAPTGLGANVTNVGTSDMASGSVGSVIGNVGGNVVGSVDSVTDGVNVTQVNGSAPAAGNLKSILLGTGHTDGVMLSAKQLKLYGSTANEGALHCQNTSTSGFGQRNYGGYTGVLNMAGTESGMECVGGIYGLYVDGDEGLHAQGTVYGVHYSGDVPVYVGGYGEWTAISLTNVNTLLTLLYNNTNDIKDDVTALQVSATAIYNSTVSIYNDMSTFDSETDGVTVSPEFAATVAEAVLTTDVSSIVGSLGVYTLSTVIMAQTYAEIVEDTLTIHKPDGTTHLQRAVAADVNSKPRTGVGPSV